MALRGVYIFVLVVAVIIKSLCNNSFSLVFLQLICIDFYNEQPCFLFQFLSIFYNSILVSIFLVFTFVLLTYAYILSFSHYWMKVFDC